MANAVGRIWLLILFLVTIQYAATQQADELTEDAFNVSTELCRIYGAMSVLVNSTLYIEGGQVDVQRCARGQTSDCSIWQDFNNYALAIPLSQSLTNVNWSSLSYKATKLPKAVPLTSRGVLWRNKEGNEFYKFGGGTNGNVSAVNYSNDTIAPTKIWKFDTNLSAWSALSPALSSDWDLQYCSVPSLDKSFALGSWSGDSTQTSMMVLDSGQSPEQSNRTSATLSPAGVYEKGAIMHLPVQREDGVLLFIGGSVTPASGAVPGNPDVPMSFVQLYDIARDRWYNQSTSTDTPDGIFPNARHNFCAQLVSTGTETFDIFMYGGDFNSVENEGYSTGLWILSIPAFRWFYFEDPDTRPQVSGSTCQVIGSHFIRFGGWNYYGPSQAPGPSCMNPLSIFDLNSFEWTDAFDPTSTYQPPTKVESWNKKNTTPLSGWNNGVQALFASTNSTSSNTPSTSFPPDKPSSPSVLPKLLGGVLGGLVIIGLLLGGILFLVKRKKKRMEMQGVSERFELAGEAHGPYTEMPASQPPVELSAIPDLLVGPPIGAKDKGPGGGLRATEIP